MVVTRNMTKLVYLLWACHVLAGMCIARWFKVNHHGNGESGGWQDGTGGSGHMVTTIPGVVNVAPYPSDIQAFHSAMAALEQYDRNQKVVLGISWLSGNRFSYHKSRTHIIEANVSNTSLWADLPIESFPDHSLWGHMELTVEYFRASTFTHREGGSPVMMGIVPADIELGVVYRRGSYTVHWVRAHRHRRHTAQASNGEI